MNTFVKLGLLAALVGVATAAPNDIVGELTLKCQAQLDEKKCNGESGCKWDCASSKCGLLAVWVPSASDLCVDHCFAEEDCGKSGVCYYEPSGACKQISKRGADPKAKAAAPPKPAVELHPVPAAAALKH